MARYSSTTKTAGMKAALVSARRSGVSRGHGTWEISTLAATRIARSIRRALPSTGHEIKIANDRYKAWPNSTKTDPGTWMLAREGNKFVPTFVFNDW